ncbi:inclusion body family protein [Streptomyces sp. NPDC053048]|uniref:inclusion body family protein n=1 Tax=Streptomyces sp. NPDC053048 TaxID=3365694 RepID=UPI0037D40FF4
MTTDEEQAQDLPREVSQIVNVLISFDAFTIHKRYPNPSQNPTSPTTVASNLIYMTTRQDRVIGYPGAELNVKATPGDIIRWRETTLSLNFDYSALLYKFVPQSGGNLISPPEVRVAERVVPVPKNGTTDFEIQEIKDHYWTTDILKTGRVQYQFYFQLLDGKNRLGYFKWDPYITIERRI